MIVYIMIVRFTQHDLSFDMHSYAITLRRIYFILLLETGMFNWSVHVPACIALIT